MHAATRTVTAESVNKFILQELSNCTLGNGTNMQGIC